jgi:hypothetical protein
VLRCLDKRYESGRGQPHSKTSRFIGVLRITRQNFGVRLSSAAFSTNCDA